MSRQYVCGGLGVYDKHPGKVTQWRPTLSRCRLDQVMQPDMTDCGGRRFHQLGAITSPLQRLATPQPSQLFTLGVCFRAEDEIFH